MTNSTNRVILVMSGGVIQEAISDIKGVDVTVLDFDTDGAAENETYQMADEGLGNYGERCFIGGPGDAYVKPERMQEICRAIDGALPSCAGTVIHGTHRLQDLLPVFVDVLKNVNYEAWHKLGDGDLRKVTTVTGDDDPWWETEDAAELLDTLFDKINAAAPEGHYFGAHPGDGSDFGFWANEPDGLAVEPDLEAAELWDWTVTGLYGDNWEVFCHHVKAHTAEGAARVVMQNFSDANISGVFPGKLEDAHDDRAEPGPAGEEERLDYDYLVKYRVRYKTGDDEEKEFICWAAGNDDAKNQFENVFTDTGEEFLGAEELA